MKINKNIIIAIILIIAIITILIVATGLTNNNIELTTNDTVGPISDLEEYNFDSYFTMNIPKNTTFEKTNHTAAGDITLYINYKDSTENINIIYAESIGGKDKLAKTYEDMAQDDENKTIKHINNATILHLKNQNSIGENDYHDIAVTGDNNRYVLVQCNNESLMNYMIKSLKFK